MATSTVVTLKVSIPDDKSDDVIDGFVRHHGYQAIIDGKANPESKDAAMARYISVYVKNCYSMRKSLDSTEAAAVAAKSASDAIVIGVG